MNASKKIRVIAALGTLSGAVWAGTFATFTDSADSVSTFTTGTVDLTATANAFASLTVDNLKPGDVKYAPLTVTNAGTLAYGYTMSTASTNADNKGLRDQLTLGIKKVANAAACDVAGVGYTASVDTADAGGSLSGAAIASRALAAGTNEVLCFRVELPGATGNSFQDSTTTATFTFAATQS